MLHQLPIPRIDFTTPTDERERRAQAIIAAYENDEHPMQILHRVQEALASNQTDVIHDVLAHLAQRMIDLNKQKQAEVKRFLSWLEGVLDPSSQTLLPQGEKGLPPRGGNAPLSPRSSGRGAGGEGPGVRGLIDSLTGKTIIQNYLGDYQKGEGETSWDDFYYRLHQNRRRFATPVAESATEVEPEYERSVAALRPIKHALARTDALIDKIVYRLYGLTDAEIELIERPQYEQALADAKAQALRDEKTDDEGKIEKIAEGILPAAKRFFDRVSPAEVEATLDSELPHWRDLPPDAPTFLLTGDYNLHALPDHMDFSSSVIPYTKAVEVVLHQRIFAPFRAQHTAADAHNAFLQAFMRGEKSLTLGSYMIILSSSRETALRRLVADADGLAAALNDESMRDVRNKAAHDEVLTRDEARQARAWALGILGRV